MDNLLQQFDVCLSSPENYLSGSVELRNSCLNLSEELFSYCHDKSGRFPTGPLCTLHTKGFDNEQVWEQIQLLNEPTIKFAKKKIKEITNMNVSQQSVDDSDKEEPLSDNEEYAEECEHHLTDDNHMTTKQSVKGQDLFFNLSEMNKFLQDEDRKYENRLDSKQNGDDNIDLFREMSSEEEDLMYGDFFDPPNEHKDSGDEESDSEEEEEASCEQGMDNTIEQQLSDDDIVELSSHQKQQQKVTVCSRHCAHRKDCIQLVIPSLNMQSVGNTVYRKTFTREHFSILSGK